MRRNLLETIIVENILKFFCRCTTKSEDDYRPLFEAFVEDLLTAVHKPEWPAAELLLSLLGKLLVQHFRSVIIEIGTFFKVKSDDYNIFSNKQIDMSLRVASLDYLGVVAARLRKDTVASQLDETALNDIILTLSEDLDDEDIASNENLVKSRKKKKKIDVNLCLWTNFFEVNQLYFKQLSEDRMQILQRALIDYLVEQKENDASIEV